MKKNLPILKNNVHFYKTKHDFLFRNSPRNVCVHTQKKVYTQKDDKKYTKNAKKGGHDIHKWLGDLCIHSKACMEAGPGYTHRARSIHKIDESGRSYTKG